MNVRLKKILLSPFTRLVAGLAVIIGIGMGGGGALLNILMKALPWPSHISLIPGMLIFCAFLCGLYVLLYRYYEGRKVTELGFRRFGLFTGAGFLTGAVYISLVVMVIAIFGSYKVTGTEVSVFLLSGLVIAIGTGVQEEILLRGIVFRLLEEKLGTYISLAISALLFGFLHISNDNATVFSSVAISLEAGVLLAAAFVCTRNLWFPIFLHAAWNFMLGDFYGLPVSGGAAQHSLLTAEVSGGDLLTGGNFGPEASVQAIIIGLLISAVMLYIAYRRGNIVPPWWISRRIARRAASNPVPVE